MKNAAGTRYMATFFRDSNQQEIDLIIETGGKTIPIEIKSSHTITSSFFNRGRWFVQQHNDEQKPYVIYGGDHAQKRATGTMLSWKDTYALLK